MARITKLQKKIVDNHIHAWENSEWDLTRHYFTKDEMIESLGKEETNRVLFKYLVQEHVSITSALLLNHGVGIGVLTDKARKDITKGFKGFLNQLNIK